MTDFTSNSFGYFIVSDGVTPRNFIVKFDTAERVRMARDIIAGQLPSLHVKGNIVTTAAIYNPGWSWHLDPASIEFFSVASNVCDQTFSNTESNLANVGNTFLTSGTICPWSSYLVAEVEPGRIQQEFIPAVQTWSTNNSVQSITINGETIRRTADYYQQFSLVCGQLPTGLTISNVGVIAGNVILLDPSITDPIKEFAYTLALSNNPAANLAMSVSNVATAAGVTLPNANAYAFAGVTNLSSLLAAEGDLIFRTYTTSVIAGRPYYRPNLYQENVFGYGNSYKYFLKTGTITSLPGAEWRVTQGQLPPNATLTALGELTVNFGQPILPLLRDEFLNLPVPARDSLEPEFWAECVQEFMSSSHELDYEFVAELVDTNGLAIAAHYFRIVHTRAPTWSEWFRTNQEYITVDPDQYYYYVCSSESEHVTWQTAGGLLGNIDNGQISEFAITASAANGERVTVDFKPGAANRFPHGLRLQPDGIISGRVGYRTHSQDAVNLPANDLYEFTVRAYSENYDSYADRRFAIQVVPTNTRPADNIWIRAYPYINQRQYFYSIINNPDLFPDELIYRPSDQWHGRAKNIRVLFAPGLNILSPAGYESVLTNNHATKRLLFGDVRTAVALNTDLSVRYEVVYLTLIDEYQALDPITKLYSRSVPAVIDLRPYITNYYIEDGLSYYLFKPNSLQNMSQVLAQAVGTYTAAAIPSWMTSVQPIPDQPGLFSAPLGFRPVVVLAYCQPGGSKKIAHAISSINFNEIEFEFDRYQLENRLSQYYDTVSNTYQAAVTTTIDSANTVFDANSTRFVENYDGYADPEQHDKYLKFPNTRVFK